MEPSAIEGVMGLIAFFAVVAGAGIIQYWVQRWTFHRHSEQAIILVQEGNDE